MSTLYVTDLDGTLLNSQTKLSEHTIERLNHLISQGMNFTYATARSFSSSSIVTKGLSLKLPVMTYNGGFFVHPENGTIIKSTTFAEEDKNFIREVFQTHSIFPLIYTLQNGVERVSWKLGSESVGIARYLKNRADDPRLKETMLEEELFCGELYYVTAIGTKEELEPLMKYFSDRSRFMCLLQLEIYTIDEYWLEIMPATATKAQGIKSMKEMFQFDKVVCFGDGLNDCSMFEVADEAYAVTNAHEALKKCASGVIESCDNDGVARWLSEHYDK